MPAALKPAVEVAPRPKAKPPIRLLFIEDSENDVILLLHRFRDAGYAPTYRYSGDAVAYCQQRFKSYDVRSGTYLGYDGRRHACP